MSPGPPRKAPSSPWIYLVDPCRARWIADNIVPIQVTMLSSKSHEARQRCFRSQAKILLGSCDSSLSVMHEIYAVDFDMDEFVADSKDRV